MKIIAVIGMLIVLSGCYIIEQRIVTPPPVVQLIENVNAENSIEEELRALEMEVGLNLLTSSTTALEQLDVMINYEGITESQIARIHTLRGILVELEEATIAVSSEYVFSEQPPFTGSDAVAMVINRIGLAPDGYEFVYDRVSVTVGIDGTGFYVFLVPSPREEGNFDIRQMFFVSDNGEILTFY